MSISELSIRTNINSRTIDKQMNGQYYFWIVARELLVTARDLAQITSNVAEKDAKDMNNFTYNMNAKLNKIVHLKQDK